MKYSKFFKSALPAAVLGFLALGLASTSAFAATTNTGTFQVTATVNTSCSIAPSTLAFGSYIGAVTNAATTIQITCNTQSVAYTVGLNGGTSGGTDTARVMAGPTTGVTLGYKLCSDSTSCAVNWGNASGTGWVSVASGTGTQTLNLYGQIPGGQVVTQGSYSDTVTASITY